MKEELVHFYLVGGAIVLTIFVWGIVQDSSVPVGQVYSYADGVCVDETGWVPLTFDVSAFAGQDIELSIEQGVCGDICGEVKVDDVCVGNICKSTFANYWSFDSAHPNVDLYGSRFTRGKKALGLLLEEKAYAKIYTLAPESSKFTISFLLRVAKPSQRSIIMMKNTAGQESGFILYINPDKTLEFCTPNDCLQSTQLQQEWNFITIVFDDGTAQIFIDGYLNAEQSGLSYTPDDAPLFINGRRGVDAFIVGVIDELTIVDTPLIATDISFNCIEYGICLTNYDSDSDGVFDNFDECPSTVPLSTADSRGCAIINSDIRFQLNKPVVNKIIIENNLIVVTVKNRESTLIQDGWYVVPKITTEGTSLFGEPTEIGSISPGDEIQIYYTKPEGIINGLSSLIVREPTSQTDFEVVR